MNAAAAAPGPASEPEQTRRLAESVQRLAHVLNRARARMLDKARHDVEWSAQVLMHTLVSQTAPPSRPRAELSTRKPVDERFGAR